VEVDSLEDGEKREHEKKRSRRDIWWPPKFLFTLHYGRRVNQRREGEFL
jgi:hypothetical protein